MMDLLSVVQGKMMIDYSKDHLIFFIVHLAVIAVGFGRDFFTISINKKKECWAKTNRHISFVYMILILY